MASRGRPRRLSSREWGVRIALAMTVAWLGWSSVAHSIANVLRNRAPQRAHALAPEDARVEGQLAMTLIGPEASAGDRARADMLARDALRRDPTVVAAATALGINAQARKRTEAAQRLFAYAQSLSRRDLPTRLWMIEAAAARGDVSGAMRHYDIALRTSRSAPDLLWPVLAGALSEPVIRVEVVRTLARRPAWAENFLPYLAVRGPDVLATADLFEQLRRARVPVGDTVRADIISRLLVAGQYAPAWRFYAAAKHGEPQQVSRDFRFSEAIATPTPFDWQPVNEGGVTATIERRPQGGLVEFAAPPSVGGIVLRQMQVLPAGTYRIDGHSVGVDQPPQSAPYWRLNCIDERDLGRVTLPNSAESNGVFSGRFVVPAQCPVQTLSLVAQPSNRLSGTSGQIDRVQLRPEN